MPLTLGQRSHTICALTLVLAIRIERMLLDESEGGGA